MFAIKLFFFHSKSINDLLSWILHDVNIVAILECLSLIGNLANLDFKRIYDPEQRNFFFVLLQYINLYTQQVPERWIEEFLGKVGSTFKEWYCYSYCCQWSSCGWWFVVWFSHKIWNDGFSIQSIFGFN